MKPSVFIATPHLGQVYQEQIMFLMSLILQHSQTDQERVVTYRGLKGVPGFLSDSRNRLVKEFLGTKCSFMLFLDSDVIPCPNILDMTDLEKDVVSATVLGVIKGVPAPVAFNYDKTLDWWVAVADMPPDSCVKVDAVGSGCILIARRVLEQIKRPFEAAYDEDGIMTLGEDLLFGWKVREAGLESWFHTGYPCKHYTHRELYPDWDEPDHVRKPTVDPKLRLVKKDEKKD